MIRSFRDDTWPAAFFIALLLIHMPYMTKSGFAQSTETVYVGSMISSGRNRPSINLGQERLLDLCVMLHQRIALPEIRKRLDCSETDLSERLDKLIAEGLVKKESNGTFYPTLTVVTIDDAGRYFTVSEAIAKAGEKLIVDKLPAIKKGSATIPGLQKVPFDKVSLFVLSDVLLDNWQLQNIERDFVRSERPLHNGMRYYYSVFERPRAAVTSPFGIYGNWGTRWGTTSISDYGNRHLSGQTLVTLSDDNVVRLFGAHLSDSAQEIRTQLGARLVNAVRGDASTLTERERQGLSSLGLINGDSLNILLFREEETKALYDLAGLITKDLVQSLNSYRSQLETIYRDSPYAEEISFGEYLIFWYHFFYTAVTNRLIRSGYVRLPVSGGATYLTVEH